LGGCSFDELHSASAFACRPNSDLHHLPFPVGEADLMAAMVSTSAGIASARAV
jgi:glycerol dehydrogenase